MPAAGTEALSGAGWPVLDAPAHWRSIDFISDLHLQAADQPTFLAWQQYLSSTPADALFILGDLFEVWVGDDLLVTPSDQSPGFEARCQQLLAAASRRMDIYFMPGNRDFLLGEAAATACGMRLLSDPTLLSFDGQRYLLSHGDALCLGDTEYQQFRAEVRQSAWREAFLAQDLSHRQAVARSLRSQSELRKASGATYADVDAAAARQWLNAARASTLIHGHTHKPGQHLLSTAGQPEMRRVVLSDWDASVTPPRLEVLRLQLGAGLQRITLAPTPSIPQPG
jgi:UDP-2,3-diacylglucosamine hydrolase